MPTTLQQVREVPTPDIVSSCPVIQRESAGYSNSCLTEEALFQGAKEGMITESLLVRVLASSCFFEQGEEEGMKGMFCWNSSLAPIPSLQTLSS